MIPSFASQHTSKQLFPRTTHQQCSSKPLITSGQPKNAELVEVFRVANLASACTAVCSALHQQIGNSTQSSNTCAPQNRIAAPIWPVPKRLRNAYTRAQHCIEQAGVSRNNLPGLVLSAALLASPLPAQGFTDLKSNAVLMTGFWAWLLAQTLKIFTKRFRKGVWDIMALFDSGGMPSSHSALCMGVTTAVALEYGLASPLFAVCLCFSCIVMYDAAGVRRHAGMQAEVLNVLVGDLLEGHPISEKKLKEVLGHTPLQVCCGASLGVLMGLMRRPMLA